MQARVGLCGRSVCPRLCVRSQHCEPGQSRFSRLLGLQRQHRVQRQQDQQARSRVVGQAIEANVVRLAGSFEAFQLHLAWERQQKGKEVPCAQQQWR
jgi:hypothetical protein